MSCSNPIDAAVLGDYWLGALPGPEEETTEAHLLGCGQCGDRLRDVIALAEGIRDLARGGSLRLIVSDTFLRLAAQEGLQVREYAPPPGGSVQCTVTAEDDILVARLAADLRDARRVDLSLCDWEGVEQFRLPDIPVHPGASGVVYQESITMAKGLPASRIMARLIAYNATGNERVLAEYRFIHTPSPGSLPPAQSEL
ncbi:MAG: hypothetical protein IPM24_06795 [Bryobacterales bacterium]|nr:hypothetical protein [Bryobacterales bacterium]